MQLPEQLRKQVEQANQFYEQQQNPEAAAPAEPAQQPAAEPTPAEPTKPTEPEQQGAQPAEPEQQPAQQQPQQDLAYWQNRFNIMQGKYNAEVPALSAKVKELESALAEARKAPAPAAAPTAQQAIDTIKQLTDEQLNEFGPDTLAMVETLINRRVGQAAPAQPDPDIAKKVERLEQAEQRRDDERQQDAEARFWASVQAGIPNLHAVNADTGFHQWLSRFDPMSGINRQQALAAAQSAWDADRVIAIFTSYFNETGQAPTKKREIPADQVQPQQSRSTAAPAAEAKVWTGADITQFYNDKARGRYSAAEADRIEADIFAATSSGRVR